MRAVLLSIKPKYCELIASGKKTIEVRKTRPKIDTPFKCYIYCTKDKYQHLYDLRPYTNGEISLLVTQHNKTSLVPQNYWNGSVIGEFVCDKIDEVYQCNSGWVQENACMRRNDFFDYLGIPRDTHFGYDKKAYAWHISDLKIYDKPKGLSEFYVEGDCDCMNCRICVWFDRGNGYVEDDCDLAYKGLSEDKSFKPIIRPPQSWCYVEELGE